MLLLAAAAGLAAHTPVNDSPTPRVVADATATVRIVSGVRLKLDSATNQDAPRAHDSNVMADGTPRKARLIEFE